MADSEASIQVVSLQGGLLTAHTLRELGTALEGKPLDVVLDCSALAGASPGGLAALLALGQRTGGKLALAGLSRSLTRTAVQARLARYFTIYSSPSAFAAARAQGESAL